VALLQTSGLGCPPVPDKPFSRLRRVSASSSTHSIKIVYISMFYVSSLLTLIITSQDENDTEEIIVKFNSGVKIVRECSCIY